MTLLMVPYDSGRKTAAMFCLEDEDLASKRKLHSLGKLLRKWWGEYNRCYLLTPTKHTHTHWLCMHLVKEIQVTSKWKKISYWYDNTKNICILINGSEQLVCWLEIRLETKSSVKGIIKTFLEYMWWHPSAMLIIF